jgi:hypothetical protein
MSLRLQPGPRRPAGSAARALAWSCRALAVVAAFLAALTLVLSVPEHVLDRDEDAGAAPAAAAAVHAGPHTVMDHQAKGHACAGHCAAHVLGELPQPQRLHAVAPVRAVWRMAEATDGLSVKSAPPDRPPRA